MICDTNSDSNYESQASNFVANSANSTNFSVVLVKSSAVLVKKRGRPADSPGTKLRKASEKALLKK